MERSCKGPADCDGTSSNFIYSGTKLEYLISIVGVPHEAYEAYCSQPEDKSNDPLSKIDFSHLNQDQASIILNMIKRHAAAVSSVDNDIGCVGITSHRIELHDTTPIRVKNRRFSENLNREIERQCEKN